MADYIVTDTELTNIANAIRTKGGTSATLSYPTGFVNAINAVPGGVKYADITSASNSISNEFKGNLFITSLYLPGITSLGTSAFEDCSNLVTVHLPAVTSLPSYGFRNCSKLQTVRLDACTSFSSKVFDDCTKLTAVYLTNTSKVCSLSSSSIQANTTYKFYVPASLLSSYKAASYWKDIADRIYSL